MRMRLWDKAKFSCGKAASNNTNCWCYSARFCRSRSCRSFISNRRTQNITCVRGWSQSMSWFCARQTFVSPRRVLLHLTGRCNSIRSSRLTTEFAANFSKQFAITFTASTIPAIQQSSSRLAALLSGRAQTWWSKSSAETSAACSTASSAEKRRKRRRSPLNRQRRLCHRPLCRRGQRCLKRLRRQVQSRRHEGDRRQRRRGPPGSSETRCPPDNGPRKGGYLFELGRADYRRAGARFVRGQRRAWDRSA